MVENLYSIYTGQYPCDNIHIANKEFFEIVNMNMSHLNECIDCNKRYSTYIRIGQQLLSKTLGAIILDEKLTQDWSDLYQE